VLFGATPAEVSPVDPVVITGPTYVCGIDECAATPGSLTPGHLTGRVIVPTLPGSSVATITAAQTNTTPLDGVIQATANVNILGTATGYASPSHGGIGMPVTVTGTGWDPQGSAPELTVLTAQAGQDASTGAAFVDANGNLSGVITIGAGDAPGANPILITQQGPGGLRAAQALFTVDATASCGAQGCDGSQNLDQNIITGSLSMSQLSNAVSFSPVTLNGAIQESTGDLGTVTVLDGRGSLDGWTVTATVSGDFVNDAGTGPNYRIPAASLRWVPRVSLAAPGSGVLAQVTAGSAANLSTTTGRTLCFAPLGGGGGAFTCDADLFLEVPASIAVGTYHATINITIS
jgi:hypothetical protein